LKKNASKRRYIADSGLVLPNGMDELIFKGMFLGLTLSFMVGPLLFAILQAGIERGFRAGLALAAGIWVSDLGFIFIAYRSLGAIDAIIRAPNFNLLSGLIGGFVLVVFGATSLMKKPAPFVEKETTADRVLDRLDGQEPAGVDHNWKRWGYMGYTIRGFLLNSINPFTIFFWLGISSAVVIPHGWNAAESLRFFSGLLLALVSTDVLKAYASKRIREFLTPGHIAWVHRAIGAGLILFGIGLAIRAM
jgi:threonine/homoserine/homoserine lactone efflux protein